MKGTLLDDKNDLDIRVVRDANGMIVSGLQVGDTTHQNQKLLLLANKGEIKEYPLRCVGIMNYLEDNNSDDLAREIRKEFIADGMIVSKIKVIIPKVEIEAKYKQ